MRYVLAMMAVCLFSFTLCAQEIQEISELQSAKIDSLLYFYYNGKTELAKELSKALMGELPNDPFIHELAAEITWQELDKKTAVSPGQPKDKKISYEIVKNNRALTEQFYREIYEGLVLSQNAINLNPNDTKNIFLRGMLLVRLGGFMAKFENEISSFRKADDHTAEGLGLLKKSIALDPMLCSTKAYFALSKYVLTKNADDSLIDKLAIKWWSEVFKFLGGNFNFSDVLVWLRESMNCHTDYYYTKDVGIDKKFIYQDILIKQAGKMDEEVLPVLLELNERFPQNSVIRNNLFLVKMHMERLERKKQSSPH